VVRGVEDQRSEPVLSVLRETVVYLSRHITFESWDRPSRELL